MRSRRHKLQVSTFPFLAVLLCAMGALLLVLLVMDRRAHAAALARAEQALHRSLSETSREAEARRSALEAARKEAHEAQEQQRAAEHARLARQVGDVESQIQAIRDQMAKAVESLAAEQDEATALKHKIETEQTKAAAEEQTLIRVRAEEANKTVQSEASRQALAQMTGELARLEQALADLKAAREKEKNTYSVVPYNGKRGESRRPLYVECAAGELIFHPDHLSVSDSREPSEVQSEVERRLLKQKQQFPPAQAAAFTPYLMLLVRPDGVLTYYHLRESLRGLKIDFGYEFIDKDWVLDFPADDRAPVPQSWAKSPQSADAATIPGASSIHIAGVPTPGQDGPPSSSPPHPVGGPPGSAGIANTVPHGVPPAGPGGKNGEDPGWHNAEPSAFGTAGKGSAGTGSPPGLFPSSGVALNTAAHGSRPGKLDAGAGIGSGNGQGGGDSASAPSAPGPVLIPPPEGTVEGSGIAAGPAVAGPPKVGAAPGSGSSVPLPELGPPRINSGQKTEKGEAAPSGDNGPADPPRPGAIAKSATGQGGGPGEDDPFLRATPTPKLPKAASRPAGLRPARLSGNRDWIIFVECKTEGVVIYPMGLLIPASALSRPPANNPLRQLVQQLIDRKQATVRPGDAPYRPEVRFLVHGDADRTYHLAYPTLDSLPAPKTAQTLAPEDDVAAITAAH